MHLISSFYRRRRRLLFVFALLCIAFAGAGPAYAEKTEYTESEKVGFAFYKLANRNPPFEEWLKGTDEFKLLKTSRKTEYLRQQTARLSKAFAEYMPDEDLIYVRTAVRIKVPTVRETEAYMRMGVNRPVQILLNELTGNYFPIQVGEMWIAVVPNDLDNYLFLSLNDQEYDALARRMALEPNGSSRYALLELRLRPVSVDIKAPMKLDGIDAWLMMAEIASISLWNNENRDVLLWEHSADWYVPKQQQDLLNLYNR
jgi:hypothetical protein